MRRPDFLFATLGLLLFAGCSSSSLDLRDDLDLHRSSFRDKLATNQALAQRFLACTTQTASDKAENHQLSGAGSLGPVRALIQRIREQRPQHADSLMALQDMASELTATSRRRLSLTDLHAVVDSVRRWHAHLDFDEDDLSQDASRFARLLLAYNTAYFGNLQFKKNPTASGSGLHAVVKATSNGFVDRGGNAVLFPGISIDLLPPDQAPRFSSITVDSQRVSADLTRIFLEAFFDAAFQVPAVHGATALRVEWPSQEAPYPEFDAAHPAIPLDALARVTRDALRAEAAVTAAVGKLVRGGNVFGTQNETLAAALETAAGVMAKKLVEHEGFCYFQVTQGTRVAGEGSPGELEPRSSSHVTR